MQIEELMERVHKTAVEKGWWDADKPRHVLADICLIHAEASEACESWRIHGMDKMLYTDEHGKIQGLASEMADILIRVLDFCKARNVPIIEALEVKSDYNTRREFRHGNKLA